MKTLGINIDGVIRDFYTQFDKQYRKVFIHNPSIVAMNETDMTYKAFSEEEEKNIEAKILEKEKELITLPVDSFDLLNHYKFDTETIEMDKRINAENYDAIQFTPKENLDNFMYEKYPFQIFATAPEYSGAMDAVNKMQHLGLSKDLFQVVLLSTHKGKAISATYSFLGGLNCRVRRIEFLTNDSDKWNICDAVIDVMPKTFQSKPEGKTSIKITHPFNQWDAADYQFDSIKEISNNEIFFNRIFKSNQ
jgi:hypothetical protein